MGPSWLDFRSKIGLWRPPGGPLGPLGGPGPLLGRSGSVQGPCLGPSWAALGNMGSTWGQNGANFGPTWPENRSPGAVASTLGSKLVSRAVWGPFSAFFSLGKPCRNAWQEVRVACFECICLCSLDKCQKTLLPLGSLFFDRFLACSLRGFVRLVTHFSGCFVELCRVVRKSS